MSDKVFVDTNILVYANDGSTGSKHDRARKSVAQLWSDHNGILSTQVLQELCVNLRRKAARPWPEEEIRRLLEDYMSWQIVVNTPSSILEAMKIESRYQVSFWDALILQAAISSGATIVYSEDFSDGQYYETVRVVNPLSEAYPG